MKTRGLGLVFAAAAMVAPAGCRSKEHLKVYCAAGLREPVKEVAAAFERAHAPTTVRMDYGGSGELLGKLKAASAPEYRPDVFVAAEESYARQAADLGLVDRTETLAYFVPVIAVAKGNPRSIRGLADLGRADVKVALGDPRGAAVGLVTDEILAKAGLMSVRKSAGGSFMTVQAVATQVSLNNADACIIWDAIARQGDFADKLETIPIPDAPSVRIVICRVSNCPHPRLADEFIRLAATEAARESFRKYGFAVAPPAAATSAGTGPAR